MRELIENLTEKTHSSADMEKFFKGLMGSTLPRFYKAVKKGDNAGILQNTGALIKTLANAPALAGERGLSDDMEKLGNKLLSAAK